MDTHREKSDISKKEIRKWAVSLSIVLSIVGGVLWYKGNSSYSLWIWALAATILVLSLITPLLLRPVYKGWLFFTPAIGWVIRMLFLAIIYYIICMPIGFVLRLSGKDLLDGDFTREAESYWKDKKVEEFDAKEYEKQY
jgi:hypothetical protein